MSYNNELTHWGVKGMKWGVRRYQNADGSLTAAGKKRYDSDISNISAKKRKDYQANPNKWVKEDLQRTKQLTEASSRMTDELKRANEKSAKNKPKARMDLSGMSDKELRDRINRELLERQYNDVFNPPKVSKGREFAGQILDSAGTVLAITGSALGVALAIKELRG